MSKKDTVKLSDKAILKISEGDYNSGEKYIDIRQYVSYKKDEFFPTKKGIRFNSKHLQEFLECLFNLKGGD